MVLNEGVAHKEPKSFVDNSIVRLDNAYLKQANSRNYHHFFPKSWLEKQGVDCAHINHVANITLVDDFLNKRVIRAQSPKTYMKEFIKHNPEIDKCLSTHLIKLNETFGVMSDDYDKFFAAQPLGHCLDGQLQSYKEGLEDMPHRC